MNPKPCFQCFDKLVCMANLQTVITNYSLDGYRHERLTFIYQGTIQIKYVLVIIDIVQLYSLLAVSSM